MWPKLKEMLRKFYKSYAWVFILLIVLDQTTKLWAHAGKWNITIIPNFLYLYYTRNTGAAWSIFDGNMAALAVVSAVVGSLIIAYRIHQRNKLTTLKKVLLAVILAGTWGNFIDRAFYKIILNSEGVVDFIMFKFGNYVFPIFNVADICVTLGIIGYALLITFEDYYIARKKAQVVEGENDEEASDN